MAERSVDRGREVRRKLLESAVELIGEVGWNAVSTRLLAERAEVRSGLVHYHFSTLQALLREAAIGAITQTLASAAPLLAGNPSPRDAVAGLLGFLDGYSGQDPTSLLFTETYLAATRDPELRSQLAELVERFRRDLAAWLAGSGQDEPEATAATLMATLDGYVLHKALDPGLNAAEIGRVLARILNDKPQAT